MYNTIVVACGDSDGKHHAITVALEMAKRFNAHLHAVIVADHLPPSTAFVAATNPEGLRILKQDQLDSRNSLLRQIIDRAAQERVAATTHVLDKADVETIRNYLHREDADLLIVPMYQEDSIVVRLLGTFYQLAHTAPCSVLGVH